jgi:hypothetical protein
MNKIELTQGTQKYVNSLIKANYFYQMNIVFDQWLQILCQTHGASENLDFLNHLKGLQVRI